MKREFDYDKAFDAATTKAYEPSQPFISGARWQHSQDSELIERLTKEIERIQKVGCGFLAEKVVAKKNIESLESQNTELKKRVEGLSKELTAARTLDAMLGDNAEICELYDDVKALEAKLKIAVDGIKRMESEETYLHGEVKKDGSRMVRDLWWIRNEMNLLLTKLSEPGVKDV